MQRRNNGSSRIALRLCTTTALLLAASGVTAGAQAATPQVTPPPPVCTPLRTLSSNSTSVSAISETICVGALGTTIIKYAVTLTRLVNGTWVLVASGTGEVTHVCVGKTSYEYAALGFTATYACG